LILVLNCILTRCLGFGYFAFKFDFFFSLKFIG